jgi:hypothetical protein
MVVNLPTVSGSISGSFATNVISSWMGCHRGGWHSTVGWNQTYKITARSNTQVPNMCCKTIFIMYDNYFLVVEEKLELFAKVFKSGEKKLERAFLYA